MNKERWDLIKHSKNFNMRIYRKGIVVLIGSLALNFLLVIGIFYVFMHFPQRDYYATNGETPPEQLKPLMAPNMTSEALLAPDPPTENMERPLPE